MCGALVSEDCEGQSRLNGALQLGFGKGDSVPKVLFRSSYLPTATDLTLAMAVGESCRFHFALVCFLFPFRIRS